jgi:urease accessory protein
MYADVLRSEVPIAAAEVSRQRAEGQIGLSVERTGAKTCPIRIAEAGSSRVRFPRGDAGSLEAVLINTGGGICCGDRFDVDLEAGSDARVVLATPAAEKVYRSDGPVAEFAVRLSLARGAEVAWLPQETILYDGARIRRSFAADLAGDARLLMFEAVVFGRTARGEDVRQGLLEDRWRIRRAGRLVHADALRLSGPIASLLDRPAIAGGGRAVATLVYVAPDAESRLAEARALLEGSLAAAGASAWNGLLAVRFLAAKPSDLRRDAVRFLEGFRGVPLPRVWQS